MSLHFYCFSTFNTVSDILGHDTIFSFSSVALNLFMVIAVVSTAILFLLVRLPLSLSIFIVRSLLLGKIIVVILCPTTVMDSSPPPPMPTPQSTPQSARSPVQTQQTTFLRSLSSPTSATIGIVDIELERSWYRVKTKLTGIFTRLEEQPAKTHPSDWASMYTEIAHLYHQKDECRKRRMYNYIRNYLEDIVESQVIHLQHLSGTTLLSEYSRRWKITLDFVKFIKRVFHHLHRFWIWDNVNNLKHDPVRPLDQLLMFFWRENVLTHLHSLIDVALELVDNERRGMKIDRSLVRNLVDNLVTLGQADLHIQCATPDFENGRHGHDKAEDGFNTASQITMQLYHQFFEEPFLASTIKFYKQQGNQKGLPKDVASFMSEILSRLDAEEKIARAILHADSVSRVRQAAEEQLIGNQVEYLVHEAKNMISNHNYKDLLVVYNLLKRVGDAALPVRTFFVRFVRDKGNTLMVNHVGALNGKEDLKHNLRLIEKLIQLHFDQYQVVTRCFDASPMFFLAVDDAFRGFVNRGMGSISLPILLAQYLDHLLKAKHSSAISFKPADNCKCESWDNGDGPKPPGAEPIISDKGDETILPAKAVSEAVHDGTLARRFTSPKIRSDLDVLDELVHFFIYIDDKELFCETYRRLLARRLLTDYNEHLEIQFISRIEAQMGGVYTQRFRGMLQDMTTSAALRDGFKRHVQKGIERVTNNESNTTVPKEGETSKRSDGKTPHVPLHHLKEVALNKNIHNVSNSLPVHDSATTKERSEVQAPIAKPAENDALTSKALELNLHVYVLNQLHWPSSKAIELRVPEVLLRCQQLFLDFYMQDKESRKLTWAHGMSTMEIAATFGVREYSVTMSACQGCLLLLFNEKEEWSIEEISSSLGVTSEEVWQQVRPLLFGKQSHMLRLVGDDTTNLYGEGEHLSRDIDSEPEKAKGDRNDKTYVQNYVNRRVRVNTGFCNARRQLLVPTTTVTLANTETTVSEKISVVDRTTQVDAVVVRIMKARRSITHVELCAEVIHMLAMHFSPDPRLIKTRIERLIDMEYISRDENDARTYRYCA